MAKINDVKFKVIAGGPVMAKDESNVVIAAKLLFKNVFIDENGFRIEKVYDNLEHNPATTIIVAYLSKNNKQFPIAAIRSTLAIKNGFKIAWISKFCILQQYRSQGCEPIKGLAKELFKLMENQIIKERPIVIKLVSTPKTITFYKNMGYKVCKSEKPDKDMTVIGTMMSKPAPKKENHMTIDIKQIEYLNEQNSNVSSNDADECEEFNQELQSLTF